MYTMKEMDVLTLMAFIELVALMNECSADDLIEAEYEEVGHN